MIGAVMMAAAALAQTYHCSGLHNEGFLSWPGPGQKNLAHIEDQSPRGADFDISLNGNSAEINWLDTVISSQKRVQKLSKYPSINNFHYISSPESCVESKKSCAVMLNLDYDTDKSINVMIGQMYSILNPTTNLPYPVIVLVYGACTRTEQQK